MSPKVPNLMRINLDTRDKRKKYINSLKTVGWGKPKILDQCCSGRILSALYDIVPAGSESSNKEILNSLIVDPLYVPENTSLNNQLKNFQKERKRVDARTE